MSAAYRPPCDEGVIRSGPVLASYDPQRGRWVLAATILGMSMAFIDGTVVNVALPALQRSLSATAADVQWVVAAYTLLLAALLLTGGSLGDRYGRRRIFGAGITLFALASLACGVAPGPHSLIAARAVQGIGAALLVPGSLAIISAAFPDEERGRAIGTWSGFSAITTALGPLLGGYLIEQISWRAVFFLNLPLAAIVLLILFTHVPESRAEGAVAPLDWWGALLVTLGLGAVVYGLIEAGSRGLADPLALGALIVGTFALAAFVVVEARSPAPMVPLSLFRSSTFSGASLLTFLLYAALGGAIFFVPFDLIQVQGYLPTAAGAAFLPFIVLMFVLSRWSGDLIQRYGAKRPLVIGPLIAAAGFALYALPGIAGEYWTTFFPAMVVMGLGMAVSVAPLTTVVMGAASSNHSGTASGINNAVSRVAGLLAIALFGIVLIGTFGSNLERRLDGLNLTPEARQVISAQRNRLAAAEVPPEVSREMRAAVRQAIALSFVAGFRVVALVAACLAVAGATTAALMIQGHEYPLEEASAAAQQADYHQASGRHIVPRRDQEKHTMRTQQQPIGSGFGAASTATEVIKGIDLSNTIAIVTGGYSGLGRETMRVLRAAGAKVIVPARHRERAATALKGIDVELQSMDLLDPASIDVFAETFLATGQPLHILVNSAGILANPLTRDARGYESQFPTNHLGHFQLVARLWPALLQAN